MAVHSHDALSYDFDLVGLVAIQVERLAVRRVFRPRENVFVIPPDEMRGAAVRVCDVQVLAIRVSSEQARIEACLVGAAPAMQKYEPVSAGREQEVVKPVVL